MQSMITLLPPWTAGLNKPAFCVKLTPGMFSGQPTFEWATAAPREHVSLPPGGGTGCAFVTTTCCLLLHPDSKDYAVNVGAIIPQFTK